MGDRAAEVRALPAQQVVLRWLLLGLVAAAAATLSRLWLSLVLAAWFTALARPLTDRLSRLFGGRPRLAAALTVVSLLLLLLPLVGACISLGAQGVEFVQNIASTEEGRNRLIRLVSDRPPSGKLPQISVDSVIRLAKQYGAQAWSGLQLVATKAATVLIGLFMFLMGAYTFLVKGDRFLTWLHAHSPIPQACVRRLAAAFHETGRGLLIGVGLTGLVQGVISTITYFALSIPSALVLGILTTVASLIPSIGTALVWIPVAGGLAFSGRWVAAIILAVVGIVVIGTVDNVMRPIFSRFGRLNLPTYVLFLAIFGGIALFGATGLILGPLLVRMGAEALEIARDQGWTTGSPASCSAREAGQVAAGVAPQEGAEQTRPSAPDRLPSEHQDRDIEHLLGQLPPELRAQVAAQPHTSRREDGKVPESFQNPSNASSEAPSSTGE
jgi:predicted PurR-regulated permease PerM